MGEKVRAVVATRPGVTEIWELPRPTIGPDEALLRVEAVGVCGTDWAFYQGRRPNLEFPLILGHECVGRIEAVGPGAAARWGVRQGDRVVVEEPFPCGECPICRTVNYHLCPHGGRYGAVPLKVPPGLWGGFAEYMFLHKNSRVYRADDATPVEELTLFIPLANGSRWVGRVGGVRAGDTVVILGPGPHGLGCVVAARQAKAGCVVMVGLSRDRQRLAIARELGAHETVNADETDVVTHVREITGGQMADVVVDVTAGAAEAFSQSLQLVRVGGTVVVAGARHRLVSDVDVDLIFKKEITIRGVYGRGGEDVRNALEVIRSQAYPLHLLCTHTFTLEETDRALRTFGRVEVTSREPVHVVVRPWGKG